MSDQSQDYQVASDVPVEQVTNQELSNAFEDQRIENEAAKTLESRDIEAEASQEQPQNNDQFSSKFAALSRKEKDLRHKEREFEARIQQFEEKMAQFEESNRQPEEPAPIPLEHRIKQNPLQALEEMGFSYEDLTQMVLNDGQLPESRKVDLRFEEIEKKYQDQLEELNNKLLDKEKQEEESRYNETLSSFKADIQEFINGSEDYDFIQAHDAHDLVFEIIEQYYDENGSILDTAEAANQVEQYLEEESTKLLERSKKLKSKFGQQPSQKPSAPASRQSPTLSNSLSATSTPVKSEKMLSREESIAQLAKQLKWHE